MRTIDNKTLQAAYTLITSDDAPFEEVSFVDNNTVVVFVRNEVHDQRYAILITETVDEEPTEPTESTKTVSTVLHVDNDATALDIAGAVGDPHRDWVVADTVDEIVDLVERYAITA